MLEGRWKKSETWRREGKGGGHGWSLLQDGCPTHAWAVSPSPDPLPGMILWMDIPPSPPLFLPDTAQKRQANPLPHLLPCPRRLPWPGLFGRLPRLEGRRRPPHPRNRPFPLSSCRARQGRKAVTGKLVLRQWRGLPLFITKQTNNQNKLKIRTETRKIASQRQASALLRHGQAAWHGMGSHRGMAAAADILQVSVLLLLPIVSRKGMKQVKRDRDDTPRRVELPLLPDRQTDGQR